jgi:hypothetical protein
MLVARESIARIKTSGISWVDKLIVRMPTIGLVGQSVLQVTVKRRLLSALDPTTIFKLTCFCIIIGRIGMFNRGQQPSRCKQRI